MNRRSSGIALAIVMLVVLVLSMVMGAFFKAYKSHFSLTRSSDASQRAAAACDAVFQYVKYRVEHDRTWATAPFGESELGDQDDAVLKFKGNPGTYTFDGKVLALDSEFTGVIYNNLIPEQSSGTASSHAEPGTLFCEISAKSGTSTRQAKFVLRVAPLFDSSVLTRGDLNVHADRLLLRSRDPNRNLLRAEGDISVPDILSSQSTQFLATDSDSADRKGMLWAKGDIYSYHPTGTGREAIDEEDELQRASQNSNGRIVSGADSSFSIYDLDENGLLLPEENTEVPIQPGRWNFVRQLANVELDVDYVRTNRVGHTETTRPESVRHVTTWVDVLEYYADPDDDRPSQVFRAAHRTDDLASQLPSQVSEGWGMGSKTYALDVNSIEAVDIQLAKYPDIDIQFPENDQLRFASGDASVTFDLAHQEVIASDNATVTIDGPFHLTSSTESDAPSPTPPPKLRLDYSSGNRWDAGGVDKAVIIARDTLNIENGVTEGLGALISRTGDVRIQPKDTNSVDVDTSLTGSGLLIFAGGNVELTNPDEGQYWNFKGLVYAREGIRMIGRGANATFEGTLVALRGSDGLGGDRSGGIEFIDSGNIEFIYNSELLDAYVKNLPGDRLQVETAYWAR